MYKIGNLPSPRADISDLADFVEVECLNNGKVSRTEIIELLGRLEDNDYTDGNPIDDPLENTLEDVFNEIDLRSSKCNKAYPFHMDYSGHVLKTNSKVENSVSYLYTYLLLSTRLVMNVDNVHAGIDGALLFEEISEEIAKEYLGSRTKSFLFGTGSTGRSFENKVNSLCKELKEGGGFKNRNDASTSNVKDDSLDIVVWKPFSDGSCGQLIAFGQCKTGTTWDNRHLTSLQPDSFCSSWFSDQPSIIPVRMFFLAESLLRERWYTTVTKAGILFDRCRIMDYSQNLSSELCKQIKTWTNAALKKKKPPVKKLAKKKTTAKMKPAKKKTAAKKKPAKKKVIKKR